ncbi:hypothetical protein [Polaromonas sp.]|uniref:hypothetical protein n=1 Tax=Polaromonas sp. TaxID=1869339 RepID=UPI00375051C3
MTSLVDRRDTLSAVGLSMVNGLATLSDSLRGRAPDAGNAAGVAAAASAHNGHDEGPAPASAEYAPPAPGTPPNRQLMIEIEDWDVMFDAVRSRLTCTVGQRLGEPPSLPELSPELSASLVQAVVLECVAEMDKLHGALKRERSQRLTP